jgi:quinol-cytochrome oxidoreductase complex cytochrome b subunit
MGAVANWLGSRYRIDGRALVEMSNEPVPNHLKHWWFCLGGTPMYLFAVQIITGILLAFYYVPDPSQAYESVAHITNDVSFGWYIRSLHKWGATLMIASVILHQMRVFFTGAYRKPRELSWVVGMVLLLLTLVCGFTGYSLVYEQLSYWGAKVGTNIAEQVPLVGHTLADVMRGGPEIGRNTMTRFFMLHAAVMPTLMVLVLALHIALIRLQGVTEFEFPQDKAKPKKTFNFFPDHLLTEVVMGLVVMIILSALACIFPAGLGERGNPLETPEVIKPEWFFYFTFRWLKLFTATTAVLSLGFLVFIAFLWPWIDAGLRKLFRNREISVYIGILAVLGIIGLTVWEALVAH